MGTLVNDIVYGAGRVFIHDYGTALPAEVNTATGGVVTVANFTSDSYVDFGEISEPVVITQEKTWKEVETHQHTASVGGILQRERVTITGTLSKGDVDGIKNVLQAATKSTTAAGAGQTGQDILKFGGVAPAYKTLVVLTDANAAGKSTIHHFYRVLITGNTAISLSKNDEVTLTFEAIAFADTTKSVGDEIGTIIEITANPTS
jgi:hypothetical protein